MNVEIKLFAVARQLIGNDRVELVLADGANVGQLREALAREHPPLRPLVQQMMIAVNTEYASDLTVIPPGAEVACIPPVSGG